MKFNETLNELMDRYSLRSADLCRLTGMSRAYASKLRSGSLLPPSFNKISEIADAIGLTTGDKILLSDAFLYERMNGEYDLARKLFYDIYTLNISGDKYRPHSANEAAIFPTNGTLLSGNRELADVIRKMSASEDKAILLFFAKENGSQGGIDELFRTVSKSVSLRWIIPMNETCDADRYNFTFFVNSIPLLCEKPGVAMKYHANVEGLLKSNVFPFFMVTEKHLLLFGDMQEKGIFFDDPAIISIYTQKFSDISEHSVGFMNVFDDATAFLNMFSFMPGMQTVSKEKSQIYIFKTNPCIAVDCSRSEMHRYAAEFENNYEITEMYMSFLGQLLNSVGKITAVFTENGLKELLEAEEFYEIGKHLSKSFTKEFRFETLRKTIDVSKKEDYINSHMLRLAGFENSDIIGMNVFNSGQFILIYDFEDKYIIVAGYEESITNTVIKYLNDFLRCDVLYSNEKTCEVMEKALQEAIDKMPADRQ